MRHKEILKNKKRVERNTCLEKTIEGKLKQEEKSREIFINKQSVLKKLRDEKEIENKRKK